METNVNRIVKIIDNDMYEITPKENGYSYIVFIATVIIQFLCFSPINSYGMIYGSYLTDPNEGIGLLTIVTGISSICFSISGFMVNVALKKFTLRQVGVVGSIFNFIGWFSMYFYKEPIYLIPSVIFMQIGVGILNSISTTGFNHHFIQKRFTLVCCYQMCMNVGTILFPLFMKFFVDYYGSRGTFLLISAIAFHNLFCVLCLHPVEWYAKKTLLYKNLDEYQSSCETSGYYEEEYDEDITLLETNSYSSFNFKKIWNQVLETLDLHLLKDKNLFILLIGTTTTLVADGAFYVIFPLYLYTIGFKPNEVAYCLSILGLSDMSCKAILTVVGKFRKICSRNVFYVAACLTTAMRIPFFYCTSYNSVLVMTFIFGFIRGNFLCTPLIYAEKYYEKFTAVYGIELLWTGLMSTVLLPILGLIHDWTGDYILVFKVLSLLPLFCIIPWSVESIVGYINIKGIAR